MIKTLLSFFLILLALANPQGAFAASKYKVLNLLEEGVNKTVFVVVDTGRIVITLPRELVPNDKFSGSMRYTPFGKTKAEKKSNLEELKTYSVMVRKAEVVDKEKLTEAQLKKGVPAPEATSESKSFSGLIPEKCKSLELALYLGERKKKYKRIKLEEAPVLEYPAKGTFSMPMVAQGNHPVVIKGSFDGLIRNSKVTMDGNNCYLLAESPRELVFRSPISIVGKSKVKFQEGSTSGVSDLVNLKLRLVVKKVKIKMGERTQIYAKVEGVGDTKQSVDLVLKNLTPDVISIIGGDEQVIQIPAGGNN